VPQVCGRIDESVMNWLSAVSNRARASGEFEFWSIKSSQEVLRVLLRSYLMLISCCRLQLYGCYEIESTLVVYDQ
jgi:hypothetical protein